MKATIVNFKGGRHTQITNQMIIKAEGVIDREKAKTLIGKTVVFACQGKLKKEIEGEVRSAHGNKGALRVLFSRGMPGQSIGRSVEFK